MALHHREKVRSGLENGSIIRTSENKKAPSEVRTRTERKTRKAPSVMKNTNRVRKTDSTAVPAVQPLIPGTKAKKTQTGKPPKGFIMINLAGIDEKKMREMARACGLQFNQVLAWGVTSAKIRLLDHFKLTCKTGLSAIDVAFLTTGGATHLVHRN